MISSDGAARRNGGKMPCESCAVQFSVFKRKRVCCECERCYCSGCLRRGGGAMCAPCRVLSTQPLARASIAHLKVRDLQCFLQRQNVSTRGCVEKDELLSLCVSHVNSAAYRRRGGARGSGAFTFKGMTNNFNEFITSAFDLRPAGPQPAPPPPQPRTGCYNSAHVHIVIPPPVPQPNSYSDIRQERFTVTPGGERDVRVPPPGAGAGGGGEGGGVSRTSSRDSAHVDSADCFEIEDVDEAGWEFVTRPADPLPNDSEILLSATDPPLRRDSAPPPQARPHASVSRENFDPGSPGLGRAASSLELRSSGSGDSVSDSASLKDEPLLDAEHKPEAAESGSEVGPAGGARVSLGALRSAHALDALSVRQLKELLARNRVEYRGCLERADLLARARMLYRDHAHYKDELENLPLEECCKICMAAPLECVLLECGHIAACTACAKQLAECPICRQYVVRAVRFFRS